jgi:hypothetical protein
METMLANGSYMFACIKAYIDKKGVFPVDP